MWIYLLALLGYLGVLLGIGFWRSGRLRTGDDFLIAGRSLPAGVLIFTLLSTWIASGSLFAGAGFAYRSGFSALWQSAGAWVGIALVYFIAPRVRRLAQYTVPDILELRYGAAARVLGTITIALAYTAIAAYQFRAGGRLLNLITGLDPLVGSLVTAAFCVAVTAFAGMLSIAYLDVGNGSMMLIGISLAVVFLAGAAGGTTEAFAALRPEQLTVFGPISPFDAFALFLPTMFLLLGEASMYQKFFSAKNERAVKLAVVGWLLGTILVETLINAVGIFGGLVIPGLTSGPSEAIVIRIALEVLPTLLGALLLCAAAAIIVSTASSFLLTPATSLIRDVYQRFMTPAATDGQVLNYTRLLVALLGAVGVAAGAFFPTILAMALWAYTMYGAGVTPALLAALVWPRATRAGGLASISAGMLTTLVWEIAGMVRGAEGEPAYLLGLQTVYPALLLSIGALIVVSLLTRPPRAAI